MRQDQEAFVPYGFHHAVGDLLRLHQAIDAGDAAGFRVGDHSSPCVIESHSASATAACLVTA